MSAPVETTAAMTAPGDATAAVTAESAAPEPQRSMPPASSAHLEGLPAGRTELRSEIRGEIGMLRAEMQAGFRSINETLLDHTDRLAQLEAAIADPAPGSSPRQPASRHGFLAVGLGPSAM